MALDIPSGLTGDIAEMAEEYNQEYYGVDDATPDSSDSSGIVDEDEGDQTDGSTSTDSSGSASTDLTSIGAGLGSFVGGAVGAGGIIDEAQASTDDSSSTTPDTTGDGTPSVDSPEEARERYGPGANQASTGGLVDTSGGTSGDPTETTDPDVGGGGPIPAPSDLDVSSTAMMAGLGALGIGAAIAYGRDN